MRLALDRHNLHSWLGCSRGFPLESLWWIAVTESRAWSILGEFAFSCRDQMFLRWTSLALRHKLVAGRQSSCCARRCQPYFSGVWSCNCSLHQRKCFSDLTIPDRGEQTSFPRLLTWFKGKTSKTFKNNQKQHIYNYRLYVIFKFHLCVDWFSFRLILPLHIHSNSRIGPTAVSRELNRLWQKKMHSNDIFFDILISTSGPNMWFFVYFNWKYILYYNVT